MHPGAAKADPTTCPHGPSGTGASMKGPSHEGKVCLKVQLLKDPWHKVALPNLVAPALHWVDRDKMCCLKRGKALKQGPGTQV